MLRRQLRHVEFLEQEIEELSVEIEERMRPFNAAIDLIDGIWGLGRRSAEAILAETGIDMSRWPTDRHFSSWAKICPGNNESAGETALGMDGERQSLAAHQLGGSRLGRLLETEQLFRRPLPPAGHAAGEKRAIVAVARALLVAIYHMLKDGTHYQDLGPEHFDRIDREAVVRRSVRRLERLGYQVTVERLAA